VEVAMLWRRQDMVSLDEMRPMLTVKDVARLLNIHVNTVRRWSDQNILKSYRVTSRGDRRFRQEDIAHYLAELNQQDLNVTVNREVGGLQ
jgi:excisionase family DNA binding protein